MTIDQFVVEHINKDRGGYRPDEVEDLVRAAWANGRLDASSKSSLSPAGEKWVKDRNDRSVPNPGTIRGEENYPGPYE